MKAALISILALALACGGTTTPVQSGGEEAPPTASDAEAFVARVEQEMLDFNEFASRTAWVRATNITYDTNWLVERMSAESTRLSVAWANEAKRFNDLELPAELRRKIELIKRSITMPAPTRDGAADELASITTELASIYSTGRITMNDAEGNPEELTLDELEVRMGTERDPARLQEMWVKWREVSTAMRQSYARMVDIANEGASELGFANVRDLWLSKYDMEPDAMAEEVDRLWSQVAPLYEQLHCYVRAELHDHYGDAISESGPLRADLMGNMWAQTWGNTSGFVLPEEGGVSYDLTEILVERNTTPEQMVRTGEAFFTSLGLPALPDTFWERSQFTRPRDRDVVCHASAWDLDDVDDLRIKMCIRINSEDFQTVHHELGHNYYQRAYAGISPIFRTGAHDGFHEAIGDFIALSVTPEYLVQLDLLEEEQLPPASADVSLLLQQALDKIAFLPFGLLIDKWRWEVFSGAVEPTGYNRRWWELRRQYQGIVPPVERPADAFDPGAKYHVANNVPYLRYFLSFILQFQFHQRACEIAGWDGPLHRCSIYGSQSVGEPFGRMLALGASQPWPETLEAFAGTRQMDGSSLVAYFAPLMEWLRTQNEGRTCGWQ
ncbi:MAG: M2 family metallopeptidase [Myxococcota bacterium]